MSSGKKPSHLDTVLAQASVINPVDHQPSAAEAQKKQAQEKEEHESEAG
jgi:hypothetical protein